MRRNRRILFSTCKLLASIFLTASIASASVTKVGNGDDGSDLEALSPITSGPIWEARKKAVEELRRLNIAGIPGLGLLIPELERTDLLLAQQDVRPTVEPKGALEISDDHRSVYARTFPEPYAATRFFPAALKLTSEQLVALHIHEALHRALPADIRTNEDIVTHLTLAMTSPGATHDRVRHIASLYIKPEPIATEVAEHSTPAPKLSTRKNVVLPPKSRTQIGYQLDAFAREKFDIGGYSNIHGLNLSTSLGGYKALASYPVEPVLRTRLRFSGTYGTGTHVGPASFDLKGRVQIDERTYAGPFVRHTLKSIDETSYLPNDRDVTTVGAFYNSNVDRSYLDFDFSYSLPNTAKRGEVTVRYSSVMSLSARTGFKWKGFKVGGMAELHASEGSEIQEDIDLGYYRHEIHHPNSIRIFALGPEFSYGGERFQVKAYGKWIMNATSAKFDDLADIVDRGAGQSAFGTSFTMLF